MDTDAFEACCAARQIPLAERISALEQAIRLYRGDLLGGQGEEWALIEVERLRALYLEALQNLVSGYKLAGDYQAALQHALLLTSHDPLREDAHRELMRLQFMLGQRNAALQQYRLVRKLLHEELRLAPMPETTALYNEILKSVEIQAPLPQAAPPLFDAFHRLPIVGRENERRDLLTCVEAAIAQHGGLALVGGEAGIGKTRLVSEIAGDAQWRGATVLWGRSRDLDGVPPYAPLVEALDKGLTPLRAGQLAHLADRTWLSQMSVLLPSLSRLIPDLPRPLRLAQKEEQARLQEAVSQYLRAVSRLSPHLIILEDIHWADEATLDVLKTIAPDLAQMRLLVLCTYREEEARESESVWEAVLTLDKLPTCRRLPLHRLSMADTQELVRLALGHANTMPDLSQHIYQETDGNPLFVGETLKTLVEEQVLCWNAVQGWSTPGLVAISQAMTASEGINRVINRRLARLNRDARAALELAAVLGQRFDFAWLASACGWESERLVAALNDLLYRQLLHERDEGYAFHHDKIRHVVYAELDPVQRRALHRQAGQALESLGPERVEELAWHMYQGEVWDKAITYGIRAGERAQSLYANKDAIDHFTRVQSLAPDSDERAVTALMHLGDIYHLLADERQALAVYRRARTALEELGNRAMLAEVSYAIAQCHFRKGRLEETMRYTQRGLEYANSIGLKRAIITGQRLLARCYHLENDMAAMRACIARAMELADRIQEWQELGECHRLLGDLELLQGDYRQALEHDFRAIELFSQVNGYEDRKAMLLNNIAEKYTCIGDAENALHYARQGLELAQKVGAATAESELHLTTADIHIYQGQWSEAREETQKGMAMAIKTKDVQQHAIGHLELGLIARGEGNLSEAIACLERGIAMTRPVAPRHIAHWDILLADLYIEQGNLKQAQALITDSLTLAQERNDRPVTGLAYRTRGNLKRAAKMWEPAAAAFEESLAVFRAPENKLELARTRLEYGLMRLARGDAERGQNLLQDALRVFVALGAGADADKVRRALYGRPVSVHLAAIGAPGGRPLRDEEKISVTWTVDDGAQDAVMLAQQGKVALRQWRLVRLLGEARSQGGEPTVSDLALALGVDERTIKRDLAALRAQGKPVATRRAKMSP